jgi:predicted DsbA family dithiol-disulfide isomerase
MTAEFSVTWDYRCPFARIGHDHLVTALADGADLRVHFKAFSLDQSHVEPGQPPVWEEPERYPALLPNLAGMVVRDHQPDRFLAAHRALFEARHAQALDLRSREVLASVLEQAGADAASVLAEVDSGRPLELLRDEHTWSAERHQAFGVPTFIAGESAVFVRLMRGPGGDAAVARRTVERIVDMITGWPELNEFKHTSLSN